MTIHGRSLEGRRERETGRPRQNIDSAAEEEEEAHLKSAPLFKAELEKLPG